MMIVKSPQSGPRVGCRSLPSEAPRRIFATQASRLGSVIRAGIPLCVRTSMAWESFPKSPSEPNRLVLLVVNEGGEHYLVSQVSEGLLYPFGEFTDPSVKEPLTIKPSEKAGIFVSQVLRHNVPGRRCRRLMAGLVCS